ncbi:MAG: DNA/RNA non-specific endonuclease, partial [Eudoraea sp.]|nr:DNA/RNA non-specific endonuclease [Eudoraea sp.]
GFFNPLVAKTGNLRDPKLGDKDTEPKTLTELLKEKYHINRKAGEENEEELQAKSEGATKEEEEELQKKSNGLENEGKQEVIQRSEIGSAGGFASNGLEYETDDGLPEIQTKTQGYAASLVRSRSNGPMIQGGWLGDAWNAVSGMASKVADLIEEGIDAAKEFIIDKVLDFVNEIPGYTLLGYILGRDPITGSKVNKTPLTLLDAVLDISPIGGEMVKWVLNYFNATSPVANWLFDAVKKFTGLISSIGTKFENFWNRLSIEDAANPERVINDVANLFQSIVTQVIDFVKEVGKEFLIMVKEIAITKLATVVKTYFPDSYDLLVLILGEDPITKEQVSPTGTNVLNAALKALGERGAQIKKQMVENGIFEKSANWIDKSINLVFALVADIGNLFTSLWEAISFESLYHPVETFNDLKLKFTAPIEKIINFMTEAMIALVDLLREAVLGKLSAWAKKQRGYFLITVLIGIDPFTSAKVARSTENIIHGFFSLMADGEAQFQQMKESGKIDQMTEKINKAVKQLNFTLEYVLGLFTSLWKSLDWNDFLKPLDVFKRIFNTFKDPVVRLVRFIVTIVKIAIEILLIAMNFPFETVNNIIQKSMEAFGNIKKDPIGFLKNILRGIKQGFVQFFNNILKHLLGGLADWLFGSLGDLGIKKPPDLTFKSILNLVLEILGISVEKIMERVWLKLTEMYGPEKVAKIKGAVDKLTGIWAFVKDVMDRGPIAIWEYIQEKLSDLWNIVLDAAKGWIMTKIISEVTAKLLSMLDPTGIMAVINSVIAIYRAIQSFIEQLRAMLEILNSFVNGVAEIAAGNIKVAADYLEGAMARGIPVLIGFLANQVGLGGIGKKLAEIIGKVRAKITEGIDWLVAKALKIGKPVIDGVLRAIEFGEDLVEKGKAKVKGAIAKIGQWWKKKKSFTGNDGKSHKLYFKGSASNAVLTVASEPTPLTDFLNEKKNNNKDDSLNATITDAISRSNEVDAIRSDLKASKDDETTKKLDAELETKMAALVPLVSKLMGGNEQSVKILEIYLSTKITDEEKAIIPQFISDLETNKNKVKDKKVFGIRTTETDKGKSTKIVRQSGMAKAGFMSIYINDEGLLMPGPEKAYVPDHKNYIPDKILVTEDDGIYKAKYSTKTFDGKEGPTFVIDISFKKAAEASEDKLQTRTLVAENLVFKPEGKPRGVTDSAKRGFHNAHLIGDRFGGSGKNQALNIYPSTPKYNTVEMDQVEDKMAAKFKNKDQFNLTVKAEIKEEKGQGANLKSLLDSEFKKDNPESTSEDNELQKELSTELQKEINKDLKALPGKFMSVDYSGSDGVSGHLGPDPYYDKFVED